MKLFPRLFFAMFLTAGMSNHAYSESAAPKPDEKEHSARASKHAYVALEPIGLTMTPVQGVRGGLLVSKDFLVDGQFGMGENSFSFLGVSTKYKKKIFAVNAKYFISKTFYIDGGYMSEFWDIQYPVEMTNGEIKEVSGGKVTQHGVDFHLGNQWWFDFGLTLGCDWAGYFAPISTSHSYKSDDTLDPVDKETAEKHATSNADGGSLHLVRFYVGYAF